MTSSDEEKTGLCCSICTGTVDTYHDVYDTFRCKSTVESLNSMARGDPFLWIVNF